MLGVLCILCVLSSACALRPLAEDAPDILPGIPPQPTLVTVVPFSVNPDAAPQWEGEVVIPAEVEGHRGLFVLDYGDPNLDLNRDFLQPSPTGGVDTITDANRLPDHTLREDRYSGQLAHYDLAHVTVRLGTLVSEYDDPQLTAALGGANPHHYNTALDHLWGNFHWGFAPRLGNIGFAVLAPFETIIDYTHQRVVLIRLDAAGRRLAAVPAYRPRWTAPLQRVTKRTGGLWFLGLQVGPENALDTLDAAENTEPRMLDTGDPGNGEVLGYGFLRPFGAFGINLRTHQFLLYHT